MVSRLGFYCGYSGIWICLYFHSRPWSNWTKTFWDKPHGKQLRWVHNIPNVHDVRTICRHLAKQDLGLDVEHKTCIQQRWSAWPFVVSQSNNLILLGKCTSLCNCTQPVHNEAFTKYFQEVCEHKFLGQIKRLHEVAKRNPKLLDGWCANTTCPRTTITCVPEGWPPKSFLRWNRSS